MIRGASALVGTHKLEKNVTLGAHLENELQDKIKDSRVQSFV